MMGGVGIDRRSPTTTASVQISLNGRCHRAALTTAAALGIVVATSTAASAHVEVSASGPAQAGTGPVTLVFSAESESSSAGIVSIQTQLPVGIAPEDVTLAGGPAGWTLTPTTDGFEVAGPDIGPGVDAEFSVTIARLPADSTELAFPTLQRYSDGREDAWIEPVTDALPDPEKPAPVLRVAPAPPGATTAATPSPTATDTATATPTMSTDTQTDEASDATGSSVGTIALVAGALAVLAIAAGGWAWRARHRG
jgi:hypothetical protein